MVDFAQMVAIDKEARLRVHAADMLATLEKIVDAYSKSHNLMPAIAEGKVLISKIKGDRHANR